jgi:hypothetical protein
MLLLNQSNEKKFLINESLLEDDSDESLISFKEYGDQNQKK